MPHDGPYGRIAPKNHALHSIRTGRAVEDIEHLLGVFQLFELSGHLPPEHRRSPGDGSVAAIGAQIQEGLSGTLNRRGFIGGELPSNSAHQRFS